MEEYGGISLGRKDSIYIMIAEICSYLLLKRCVQAVKRSGFQGFSRPIFFGPNSRVNPSYERLSSRESPLIAK